MRVFILRSWTLLLRDYHIRFRRTLFSFFWFLAPLFTLVGGAWLIGKDVGWYDTHDSVAYLASLVAGLICWQLMIDAWLEPVRLARRVRPLLAAVNFDQRTLLGAGVMGALVAFAVKLPVLLAVLYWSSSGWPTATGLVLVGLITLLAVGAALAAFTLPVSLALLDVRYALPFIQYALLVATPIFYSTPDEGIVQTINLVNPITYLVPPVRNLIVGEPTPASFVLWAALCALGLLLLGQKYFKAKIRLAIAYVSR